MTSAAGAVIRPARRDDVPALAAIYNHAVATSAASWDHEPLSLDDRLAWFDGRVADGWPILVAELDGHVLGYASYGPFRPKLGWTSTAEHSVYLDPDAQGRGIGGLLMGALIGAARAQGLHALIGVLDADNAASVALHRRLGFVEVGRFPQAGFKFGRWLDASFWQLVLDDRPAPAAESPR